MSDETEQILKVVSEDTEQAEHKMKTSEEGVYDEQSEHKRNKVSEDERNKVSEDALMDLEADIKCPICLEIYECEGATPSITTMTKQDQPFIVVTGASIPTASSTNSSAMRFPIESATCNHFICKPCLETKHAAEGARRVYVSCSICRSTKAYYMGNELKNLKVATTLCHYLRVRPLLSQNQLLPQQSRNQSKVNKTSSDLTTEEERNNPKISFIEKQKQKELELKRKARMENERGAPPPPPPTKKKCVNRKRSVSSTSSQQYTGTELTGIMPSDKQIKDWVEHYVLCFDLYKVTTRHALSTATGKFHCDMRPKKHMIEELLKDTILDTKGGSIPPH